MQYRELYKQIEEGREVIGRIILDGEEIRYKNIPEKLVEELDFWGVRVGGEMYTPTNKPDMFFKCLPMAFIQGRIRVSRIQEGD